MKNPAWLSSEKNRQTKKHASIVIALENAQQAEDALKNRLCIAGLWLNSQEYKSSTAQTQCQNCQKWGHSTRLCKSKAICQICAEKHSTLSHKCNICKINGKECPHSALKCANCKEDHKANSNICEFSKRKTHVSKTAQNLKQKSQTAAANIQHFQQNEDYDVEMQSASKSLIDVVITNELKK
jgi:hypothetical protein